MQIQENGHHAIVAYASKSLNEAQQAYPATIKQCLVILWALNHFRFYLHGKEFTLFTDHNLLVSTLQSSMLSQRMLRDWTAQILEFNLKIAHQPGKLMIIPEVLSQIHYTLMESMKMKCKMNHSDHTITRKYQRTSTITKGSRKTTCRNTHIMTFVDHFTGFVKTYPIPQYTATILAVGCYHMFATLGYP